LEQKTDSRERFNAAAENWDDNPQRVSLARQVMLSMQGVIPFQASWNALEIGCGTGLLSYPVSGEVASLTAIDTSEGMINELKKKIREHNLSNIQPLVTDMLSVSFQPEHEKQYDLIFSSMTFHHIGNVNKALQTLYSMLLPEGFLAVADLDEEDGSFHDSEDEKVHHGFRRDLFQEMLLHEGFSDISFSTAATLTKINHASKEKTYSVFLAVARKSKKQ